MELSFSETDQGLERFPHLRPPISDPPSQTPHLRPLISDPPSQAPHLRPPISDPPSQTPHLRPRQCQTLHFSFETTISGPSMQCLTTHFSCETTISGPNNVRPHTYLPPQKSTFLNSNSIWKQWMKSHLVEIPLQIPLLLLSCETTISGPKTPHFSRETTISGPDNVRLYTYTCLSRVQYQAPTMSDPTLFVRDYNIKPWQCQTTRFSFETTISGADNVRPHTFLARLQYHAPTMSDPTVFVRNYNIRPRQCQTPHFSIETTISGPDNRVPKWWRHKNDFFEIMGYDVIFL